MRTVTVPHWIPSLSVHMLIVALALLIYVLKTRAGRERRSPVVAITWVMGLVLLPYVMLPLYLAFGRRKFVAPARSRPPTNVASEPWPIALLGSFGIAPPTPATVRLHADGVSARAALWRVFDAARDTLDVCTFLIGNDVFGREVLARLAARARAGVRVRLLYDGLSAWIPSRRALRELEEAGAEIAVFHPLLIGRRISPRNLRNHRKLVIADHALLWAGGRNLAAEYFVRQGNKEPWLDLSFDLDGEVAGVAAHQFAADWNDARHRTHSSHRPIPPSVRCMHGAPTQFLPSGPDQAEDTAEALLIAACFRAQRRVLAITPYFVPDASLQQALRLAARRGVEVTLVIPAVSNHRLADFVRGRSLRELAHAGAHICLLPLMSHAKAVVVDDEFAMSGSINLDSRSLLLNYECAVVFYGATEIAWLADWISTRATQCHPFDSSRPGLLRDIAEGALLAVAFQI
jgi:cardiolipin synthase